jgi:hypothetical protein
MIQIHEFKPEEWMKRLHNLARRNMHEFGSLGFSEVAVSPILFGQLLYLASENPAWSYYAREQGVLTIHTIAGPVVIKEAKSI